MVPFLSYRGNKELIPENCKSTQDKPFTVENFLAAFYRISDRHQRSSLLKLDLIRMFQTERQNYWRLESESG